MKLNNDEIGFVIGQNEKVDLTETNDKIDSLKNKVEELENTVEPLENKVEDLETSKVDKVEGKTLSSNDFTDVEKDKLSKLKNAEIVDDLTSEETNKALSANQGRILSDKLDSLSEAVTSKANSSEVNRLKNHMGIVKGDIEVNTSEVKEARGVYGTLNERKVVIDEKIKGIEKKNKIQDIYVNGLLNENADQRITIEEEGSFIELTNSKNGLVDIDKIVGNTLTNHLIPKVNENLNPSINKYGVDIALNDTVEDGVVDVELEGNTLVNLVKTPKYNYVSSDNLTALYKITKTDTSVEVVAENITTCNWRYIYVADIKLNLLKPYTEYTLCFKDLEIDISDVSVSIMKSSGMTNLTDNAKLINGVTKYKLTTNNLENKYDQIIYLWINSRLTDFRVKISDVILLEGDWTDKEVPMEYFEGMKSVGEKKDGEHKIEVTVRNKNLYDGVFIDNNIDLAIMGTNNICTKDHIELESGKQYTISNNLNYHCTLFLYDENFKGVYADKVLLSYNYLCPTFIMPNGYKYIKFRTWSDENDKNVKFQIEENDTPTSYAKSELTKKEIPLTEPLRGLPSGIKDKIVKIGGEWFIERNCKELELTTEMNWVLANTDKIPYIRHIINEGDNIVAGLDSSNLICNSLSPARLYTTNDVKGIALFKGGTVSIRLTDSDTLESFKEWLSNNPTRIVYQLETPIYEPLDTLSELLTYLDATHISNDSLIPCNMNVKNKGYKTSNVNITKTYTVVADGASSIDYTVDNFDNVRFSGEGTATNVRMIEGILSEKLIPKTLMGTKSTFENEKITQAMIDSGKEKQENLGKYKVNAVVKKDNTYYKSNAVYLSSPLKKDDELIYKEDGLYHYHVYEEDEPYYEKILEGKLVVEIAENSILEIRSVIPCQTAEVTYTSNIPSTKTVKKEAEVNTRSIEETQMAVDFILMEALEEEPSDEITTMSTRNISMNGLTKKGGEAMGAYFASRIMKGYLSYSAVIKRYPQFKDDIDFILRCEGREDLIVEG